MSVIVVTNDPAVTVAQDNPAITAIVPVASQPPTKVGYSISTPLPPTTDFNTVTAAGFYYTADTLSLNAPVTSQSWYLNVDVDGADPTSCRQIATELTGTLPLTFIRTQVAGTWGTWSQVVGLDSLGRLPAVDGSQLTNVGSTPRGFNCGRLVFTNATTLTLQPYKGNLILINGTLYPIPSAGVTVTNTGLSASTLYYVYALVSGGNVALELSTTTHATSATSGNVGTEIKSGDDTRALVGIIRTTASGTFADSTTQRFVRSWFNRPTAVLNSPGIVNTSLNGVIQEVTSTIRTEMVVFSGDVVSVAGAVSYFNSTSSAIIVLTMNLDGTTSLATNNVINGDGSGQVRAIGCVGGIAPAEGYHYLTMFGSVNTGSASLYSGTNYVATISGT
jgi:hypothetical protein